MILRARLLLPATLAITAIACRSGPGPDAAPTSAPDPGQTLSVDMNAIAKACRWYSTNNAGNFPDTLQAIVTPDVNGKTYLDDRRALPLDPWGNSYGYELLEPVRARLTSFGADGSPGGEGANADLRTELSSVPHR